MAVFTHFLIFIIVWWILFFIFLPLKIKSPKKIGVDGIPLIKNNLLKNLNLKRINKKKFGNNEYSNYLIN